jgi:hypothetical protein
LRAPKIGTFILDIAVVQQSKTSTMSNRRDFLRGLTTAGLLSSIPFVAYSQNNAPIVQKKSGKPKIWACLLHLSPNMWEDYYNQLQFEESVWNDALDKMVESKLNMVVIDLGDGVKYKSHPEIAIDKAWTTTRLKEELAKLRTMGLEPIPKLNFSTCHDAWLGKYGRMVSSKEYYDVCRDLIEEVIYLFDKPRFFHLGMDEEKVPYQSPRNHMVIRLNELYWGDMYFLIGEVFKGGSRPWIWQDYIRSHKDEFSRMMPKSVLQSNWYNKNDFSKPFNKSVQAYLDLEELGFDQVPGGSNVYEGTEQCFFNNVKFCSENIAHQRLIGFIQSPWKRPITEYRTLILKSIELAGEARKWYYNNYS